VAFIPGKFVWFEHVSNDCAKARAFYEPLFDWHTERMPLGSANYEMIMNAGEGIGGFSSFTSGAGSARWISYVSVPDVDKTYAASLAAGASSESAPADFGDVGRGAAIVDPAGARISLWKSAHEDRPDRDVTPIGSWVWNELLTSDPTGALSFYTRLIGYARETMDTGGHGTYHILKTGERSRAGVMQTMDPKVPSAWVPYVRVNDADATARTARQLGGTVCVPATDIPFVGRFAVLADPQGAMVGVIKMLPQE
jgi:predicted enzyme related to lactoylglutathione lyase